MIPITPMAVESEWKPITNKIPQSNPSDNPTDVSSPKELKKLQTTNTNKNPSLKEMILIWGPNTRKAPNIKTFLIMTILNTKNSNLNSKNNHQPNVTPSPQTVIQLMGLRWSRFHLMNLKNCLNSINIMKKKWQFYRDSWTSIEKPPQKTVKAL